jgi:hypothetical protein
MALGGLGALGGGTLTGVSAYKLGKKTGEVARSGNGPSSDDLKYAGKYAGLGLLGMGGALAGGKTAALGAGLYAGDKVYDYYKKYKDKPKNVVAKAIAKLRKAYANIMKKANAASDKTVGGKLKRIAGKILTVIDKLMEKLQKGANKFSK